MSYSIRELRKRVTLTGKGVNIYVSATVTLEGRSSGRGKLIELGDYITITAGCMFLTHDAMGNNKDGFVKMGKIQVEDYVSIGVCTIVLPGVRIGRESIVAANSVLPSGTDIPPGEVWGGNPARRLCSIEEYLEKRKAMPHVSADMPGLVRSLKPLETVLIDGEYGLPSRRGRG